jgi:hypothetical protein
MADFVAWAAGLAGEQLNGVLPPRRAHVCCVARRTRAMAPQLSADNNMLLIGAALLRDVGDAPDLAKRACGRDGLPPLPGDHYLMPSLGAIRSRGPSEAAVLGCCAWRRP